MACRDGRVVMRGRLVTGVALFLAAACPGALAHSPGTSHLTLELPDSGPPRLTADLALIDLAQALPLDADRDARLTWAEVQAARPSIAAYLRERVQFDSDAGQCELRARQADLAVTQYAGVAHASLALPLDCPGGAGLTMASALFGDIDPRHRTLARVVDDDERLFVLGGERERVRIEAGHGLRGMVMHGIRHILAGYDHLLFLLLLILPAAAMQRGRLLHVAGIVTAFTLAHSVTLSLATLGLVTLPGRPVEAAIAISIVVAAGMNLWRPGHRTGWPLAFAFGLLHGFGFAGALSELGLASATLVRSLVAFNVGVELGQLLAVLVALPLLAVLALRRAYLRAVVPALSAAAAITGLYWAVIRF